MWFHLCPGRPLSFWLRVHARCKARRVRKTDLSAVKAIALAEPYPIRMENTHHDF